MYGNVLFQTKNYVLIASHGKKFPISYEREFLKVNHVCWGSFDPASLDDLGDLQLGLV